MEQSAVEAWQVTGAFDCSIKSWVSVLDIILVAQGLVLLGTLSDIEATQKDSDSAGLLLLDKGKPPNAQSVEQETLHLRVLGLRPMLGIICRWRFFYPALSHSHF